MFLPYSTDTLFSITKAYALLQSTGRYIQYAKLLSARETWTETDFTESSLQNVQ